MSAQVAADLRAAADVLERDGWTQGGYIDERGCKCIAGAINLVITGAVHKVGVDSRTSEAKGAFKRVHGFWPTQFNDEPGRTAAEVIAALRVAADRAEVVQ